MLKELEIDLSGKRREWEGIVIIPVANFDEIKKEYDKILVEEYIPGKEIQAAVMGDKALGAIELIPKR